MPKSMKRYRLNSALALSASAALYLFAPATPAADDPGAPLFNEHCSGCHAVSEVSTSLKVRTQDQERAVAKMREFLPSHSPVNEAQARAIVKYLQAEANRN